MGNNFFNARASPSAWGESRNQMILAISDEATIGTRSHSAETYRNVQINSGKPDAESRYMRLKFALSYKTLFCNNNELIIYVMTNV